MPELRFTFPHPVPCRFIRQYPPSYGVNMDYCRGVAELAHELQDRRAVMSHCSSTHEVHIQEVTECIARGEPQWHTPRFSFNERPQPRPLPREVTLAMAGPAEAARQYSQHLREIQGCRVVTAAAAPALVADRQVDLAINLVELAQRARLTLALLRTRKHVFSASPLADTRESAEAMRTLSDSLGLRLECAPDERVSAQVYALAEQLVRGCIGTVSSIRSDIAVTTAEPLEQLTWGALLGAPGAWLRYLLWLASWTLGPIWQVSPLRCRVQGQMEGDLVFATGAILHLSCRPVLASGESVALQFIGEHNTVQVLRTGSSESIELETPFPRADIPDIPPGVTAINQMCRAICAGTVSRHSADHAIHQWQIIELMSTADASRRDAAAREAPQGSWIVCAPERSSPISPRASVV